MRLIISESAREMFSPRSARYAAGVLALPLLCWWTATRNPITSGLFFYAAFWTFMHWTVKDAG
jgi:hypothetical protein